MGVEGNGNGVPKIVKENRNFTERIAKLNNLAPEDVKPKEIHTVYRAYMREAPIPPQLEEKYFDPEKSRRGKREQKQTFSQLTEALLDLPPNSISYGLFARDYTEALLLQQDLFPSKESHTSVLVGATTQDEIKEYAATVRSIHPDARCYVTDSEGEDTANVDSNVARFMKREATDLPFAPNSVDSVHTNFLLGNLPSQDKQAADTPQERFYKEAHRVLSDSGVLVMIEREGSVSPTELSRAGFTNMITEEASQFASRRDMERALTFGESDEPYIFDQHPGTEWVISTKNEPTGKIQKENE